MNKIKNLLSNFGYWLWNKNRVITATEITLLNEAKNQRCPHCGKKLLTLSK